jgi:hypothetical protein
MIKRAALNASDAVKMNASPEGRGLRLQAQTAGQQFAPVACEKPFRSGREDVTSLVPDR